MRTTLTGDVMADDHSQRLFRTNTAPVSGGQGRGQTPPAGNDPLAELARLIGQNDPFGEYGREQTRPQPAAVSAGARPMSPTTPLQWDIDQSHAVYSQHDPLVEPPTVPPGYAGAPHGGAYDETTRESGYYAAPQASEHEPYDPNNPHYAHEDQDYYDDVPPARRRTGMLAIAGIFVLAVIGTAGAFGYRALFGSSGSHGPPPVIKADTAPSKIVPAGTAKDASSKLITDRLNDRSQNERLVSREERPVDINAGQAGSGLTTGQVVGQPGAALPPRGSGVIATEPKKVRTIAIRPDGAMEAEATPPVAVQPPEQPEMQAVPPLAVMPAPAPEPPPAPAPMQIANPQPAPEPEPPRSVAARPAPAPHRQAPAVSHAPLSLSPDAPAPRAAAPTRTASVAPTQLAPRTADVAHGYAVQVSSQRSEAEAQAAFRGLQGKFPNQLGAYQVMINRVDLGAKGVYYRALVGPFASGGEASQLCSSLKAAGGQCIVQKN